MSILESATILKYFFDRDENTNDVIKRGFEYNGNSVATARYNLNQRDLPYNLEIKPYGYIGIPSQDTNAITLDTNIIGYLDNRVPYQNTTFTEDSSNLYTQSSNIKTNLTSISLNVKQNDDEEDDKNIETSIGRDGLKFQGEYLSKFNELKEAINDIVGIINKVNEAIPSGVSAEITSDIQDLNNKVEEIATKIEE